MEEQKKKQFENRMVELVKEFGFDRILCFVGEGQHDSHYFYGDQKRLADAIVAVTKAEDNIKPIICDAIGRLDSDCMNWIFQGGGDLPESTPDWPESTPDWPESTPDEKGSEND